MTDMLASSNGLGTLTFNQKNVGSTPIASANLMSVPFNSEIRERIAAIEPCAGFFESIQGMGGYVAGGFARYVLGHTTDIPADDVDIFCMNEDSFNKILDAFIYNPKNNLDGSMHTKQTIPYGEEKTDELVSVKYVGHPTKFQFVRRNNCSLPEDIIEDFDISVCCVFLDFKNKIVFFTKEFLEDEIKKNLRLVNVKMNLPMHVITYRLQKYLKKGYKIYLSELFRIEAALKPHPEYKNLILSHDLYIDSVNSSLIKNAFHKEEDYKMLVGMKNFSEMPENMLG